MFVVTRVIGTIPTGSLQPSSIQIAGTFTCPGSSAPASGVDLELTITGPGPGFPSTTFSATTGTGTGGSSPVGTVVFTIPAWPASQCGATVNFTVRGNCNGQWTALETLSGLIDCPGCARVTGLRFMLGPCRGMPPKQTVTLFATVALSPNSTGTFTLDFGDGSPAAQISVSNPTSSFNNLQPISASHDYDATAGAGPFLACLRPPGGDCPRVCIEIKPDCTLNTCPVATGAAVAGSCNPDGSRTVTYTLTLSPPAPQNSSVQVVWAFGGPNTSMATSATQTVSTTGGPVTTVTFTTNLAHRSVTYDSTATVIVQIPGQSCPVQVVPISIDPASCLPCPDPMAPVTVTMRHRHIQGWCAPVATGIGAQLCAHVNWAQPPPMNPPAPVSFNWSVLLPDGRIATQSSTSNCVSTTSGWTGPGSANGALDLTSPGTYTVSAVAVFDPNAGLPTNCILNGELAFPLQPCPSTTPCPSLSGLTVTSACADPATGTVAMVTATATVNDPAGIASGFAWDFGDPGSTGNQMTTTAPSASHGYMNPGNYTVSCTVSSNVPCAPMGSTTSSTSAPIPTCGKSNGGGGGGGGGSSKFGCDILLYIALVLIALSSVLAVIGCIISKVGSPLVAEILGIIAAGLLTIGLVLLGLWWFLCRFFTACQALLDAIDFAGVMLIIFAIITAVLALVAKFGNPDLWLCVGAAFFNSVLWGLLTYFLYKVAEAVGCLIPNPSGGNPPTKPHSSSGLSSADGTRFPPGSPPHRMIHQSNFQTESMTSGASANLRASPQHPAEAATFQVAHPPPQAGLGDVIMRATKAMGIAPCAGCLERAAQLNAWSGVGRTSRSQP